VAIRVVQKNECVNAKLIMALELFLFILFF
jgi:hypothetical protein